MDTDADGYRVGADESGDDAEQSFWDVFEPLRPESSQVALPATVCLCTVVAK